MTTITDVVDRAQAAGNGESGTSFSVHGEERSTQKHVVPELWLFFFL